MIGFFLSHGILLLLGLPVLAHCSKRHIFDLQKDPFALALAYVLGEFTLGSYLFFLSVISVPHSKLTILFALMLAWVSLFTMQPKSTPDDEGKTSGRQWAAVLLLAVFLGHHGAQAFCYPLVAWDARSVWFFHAKAIYFHSGLAIDFLQNPNYLWSHPEYPPAIPLLAAFHASFQDTWSEIHTKSFLLIHWFCALLALAQLSYRRGVPPLIIAALLISIDLLMGHNLAHGYADSFLTVILLLGMFSDSPPVRLLLLAFAAAVKAEGLAYVGLFYLLRVLFLKLRKEALLEAILAAVLCSPWKLFIWYHSIEGEYQWNLSSLQSLSAEQLQRRLQLVLEFAAESLQVSVGMSGAVLLLVALLISPLIALRARHRDLTFFWLLALTQWVFILCIYLSSPVPVQWLLDNSFIRVCYFPFGFSMMLFTFATAVAKRNM